MFCLAAILLNKGGSLAKNASPVYARQTDHQMLHVMQAGGALTQRPKPHPRTVDAALGPGWAMPRQLLRDQIPHVCANQQKMAGIWKIHL